MAKRAAGVSGKNRNQARRRKSPADQVAVCMGILCMEIDSVGMGPLWVFREAKVDSLYFALLD